MCCRVARAAIYWPPGGRYPAKFFPCIIAFPSPGGWRCSFHRWQVQSSENSGHSPGPHSKEGVDQGLRGSFSDSVGHTDSNGQFGGRLHLLTLVLFIFMIHVWDFTFPSWIREAGQCLLLVESLVSEILDFSVSPRSCVLYPSLPGVLQSLSWSGSPCVTSSASHLSKSLWLHRFP